MAEKFRRQVEDLGLRYKKRKVRSEVVIQGKYGKAPEATGVSHGNMGMSQSRVPTAVRSQKPRTVVMKQSERQATMRFRSSTNRTTRRWMSY